MKIVVTGSSGHLGEALARTLIDLGHTVIGIDIKPAAFTTHLGSITDLQYVTNCVAGAEVIFHTATLHKPHVATHSYQEFVDVNITGTLNLLQAARAEGIDRFIFTSTTSVFGDALVPAPGLPAAWITEAVVPVPKNIYGVTKLAAEDLCQLFHRKFGLNCIILRTSRFFPEEDDSAETRNAYADENSKANEYLFRRVDLHDAVTAHVAASDRARNIGFGKYIVSATSPFTENDLSELRNNAPAVIRRLFPEYEKEYDRRGWKMFPSIDRVYVNDSARMALGWHPRYDFGFILHQLATGKDFRSPLTGLVGSKGYHAEKFVNGPYPV